MLPSKGPLLCMGWHRVLQIFPHGQKVYNTYSTGDTFTCYKLCFTICLSTTHHYQIALCNTFNCNSYSKQQLSGCLCDTWKKGIPAAAKGSCFLHILIAACFGFKHAKCKTFMIYCCFTSWLYFTDVESWIYKAFLTYILRTHQVRLWFWARVRAHV